MKPKWQRARLIIDPPSKILKRGTEIWVKGAPVVIDAQEWSRARLLKPELRYWTNIKPPSNDILVIVVVSHALELLARGPEDFADEVEMVTLKELQALTPPRKAR